MLCALDVNLDSEPWPPFYRVRYPRGDTPK